MFFKGCKRKKEKRISLNKFTNEKENQKRKIVK